MKRIELLDNCTQCGACKDICPVNAIDFIRDTDYSEKPVIFAEKCINCNRCEYACPVLHSDSNAGEVTAGYIGYTKEKHILQNSSSGGIFTCLAATVIENGGVVCGAVYDADYSVRHIVTQNYEDIIRMQGSKYSQSNVLGCYCETKNELLAGRQVLFSGTPCEIAGLKRFLGKEYNGLVTVGFVCHGVPKSYYLPEYVKGLEQHYRGRATSFSLRSKESGWTDFCVKADFDNGKHYSMRFTEDPYMRAFLLDYSLKESCYGCKFKCNTPKCDLILADFWGAEVYNRSQEELRGGISAILVYGEKGESVIRRLQGMSEVYLEEFAPEKILKHNQHYFNSAIRTDKVDRFNDSVQRVGVYQTIMTMCSMTKADLLRTRLKRKIIRICDLLWKKA